MNNELLRSYISGNATDNEKQRIVEWLRESPENMCEYKTQRKLHDIALWRATCALEKKKQPKKPFSLRTLRIEAAKIAAIFAIILLGTHYWPDKHETEHRGAVLQTLHAPAGQRAEVILADGTKVWLNSLSTLTFPGNFGGDSRKVKLNGEGYFVVAKNTEQPFIVETNKCNVKALGTEFNIMAYTTDSIWETALLEGSVEILRAGATNGMILSPNTMARLKGKTLIKERITEQDHFLWRDGLICFNNVSVKDMIGKLSLYYGVDFVVNNTRILNNHYTGKFRTRDGVEHVLKVLRLNNKFSYKKDDEKNVITIN